MIYMANSYNSIRMLYLVYVEPKTSFQISERLKQINFKNPHPVPIPFLTFSFLHFRIGSDWL